MTLPVILCNTCARYLGQRTCEAFDQQIPLDIFLRGYDHTKTYDGDHDLHYVPREEPEDDNIGPANLS